MSLTIRGTMVTTSINSDQTPSSTESMIEVSNVDCHKPKNGKEHHTEDFDLKDLVVRRGQPFRVTIHFNRDIKPGNDVIILLFSFGEDPKESKQTLHRLKLNLNAGSPAVKLGTSWSVKLLGTSKTAVDVSIETPADAFVGKYLFSVETRSKGDEKSTHKYSSPNVYVLFNPWCAGDVVYMADEAERQEYVMKDSGLLWNGSASEILYRPWLFSQFDSSVLDAALFLLDKAKIPVYERGNAVIISRQLTAMTNGDDDNGILFGNWKEIDLVSGITSPSEWIGSVAIIEQYMTMMTPVQYGQCWVFAGVLTSLLRSLGIPTRCVTGYDVSHDTNKSMMIDKIFNADNSLREVEGLWNFHVWNESYFRRTDLPGGVYDGWQLLDATPQTVSDGKFQVGPAPVKAIKEGHVHVKYDVDYCFCAVNGDMLTWMANDKGKLILRDVNTSFVGKYICTTAVGSNNRQDLTLNYKYEEGSKKERQIMESVLSNKKIHVELPPAKNDVQFKLNAPSSIDYGQPILVSLKIENKSTETRMISGILEAIITGYHGKIFKLLKQQSIQTQIAAGQENTVTLTLEPKNYMTKLKPETILNFSAGLNVKETGSIFSEIKPFMFRKPVLKIEVPSSGTVGQQITGHVSFTNTLNIPLNSGRISIAGTSLKSDPLIISNAIKPGRTVSLDFTFVTQKKGLQDIVASFTSQELSGVISHAQITIQ